MLLDRHRSKATISKYKEWEEIWRIVSERPGFSPYHHPLSLSPLPLQLLHILAAFPNFLKQNPAKTIHEPLQLKAWCHIIFSGDVGDLTGKESARCGGCRWLAGGHYLGPRSPGIWRKGGVLKWPKGRDCRERLGRWGFRAEMGGDMRPASLQPRPPGRLGWGTPGSSSGLGDLRRKMPIAFVTKSDSSIGAQGDRSFREIHSHFTFSVFAICICPL